jgi:ABC-type glycerol-3-phosphate transport system substrate-binding protein
MVAEIPDALPTPMETEFTVSRDAFLTGKVAMAEQWTDIGIMAEDPSMSMIKGDWGVVEMPLEPGVGSDVPHRSALNAGYALAIASKAPNPALARAFILFATRPDILQRLVVINGGIDPVRKSVIASAAYRNFAPQVSVVVSAALPSATAWPSGKQADVLMASLASHLSTALKGQASPKQALDDTQASWLAMLDSPQ